MGKTKRNEAAIAIVRKMMDEAGLGTPEYVDHNKAKDATRLKYFVGLGDKAQAASSEADKKSKLEAVLPEMEAATGYKLDHYFKTALVHSYVSHSEYPVRYLYVWVPDNKEAA